jgi:hypothetical protein
MKCYSNMALKVLLVNSMRILSPCILVEFHNKIDIVNMRRHTLRIQTQISLDCEIFYNQTYFVRSNETCSICKDLKCVVR